MKDQKWGYEFDMKEIESGGFQASYWLISPTGELSEPVMMPVCASREDSLDEAQAAGKAAATSKSQ